MKKPFTIFFILAIPLFCMAQNPLERFYEYDASGNRTARKTVRLMESPPAPPEDSLQVTSNEYFVEKVAQIEMKIYPNPATEKIMLEITNLQDLQTGVFKLYNLNGQLLKECPVQSVSTEVSLAGLSAGVYILKVNINGRVEDWKIIKQ